DNFFELGGHSLLALRVIERMRSVGLHVDVHLLFDTPSVAELASALREKSDVLEAPANGILPGTQTITLEMLTLWD
ncbi:MAG: phosphopantetheine-binding protein, partial [Vulcanimicrobiaceae bacterium]